MVIADGWYRKGSFHIRYEDGKTVDAIDFKSINKAKRANRVTKYKVIHE